VALLFCGVGCFSRICFAFRFVGKGHVLLRFSCIVRTCSLRRMSWKCKSSRETRALYACAQKVQVENKSFHCRRSRPSDLRLLHVSHPQQHSSASYVHSPRLHYGRGIRLSPQTKPLRSLFRRVFSDGNSSLKQFVTGDVAVPTYEDGTKPKAHVCRTFGAPQNAHTHTRTHAHEDGAGMLQAAPTLGCINKNFCNRQRRKKD